MSKLPKRTGALPAAFLAFALIGCADEGAPAGGPPQGAAQAPAVSVTEVRARPVDREVTLPGRVSASRVAEVRPQVQGIVTERLFAEGQAVAAGEPLYRIDAAPYRAAYDQAVAELARAEALVSASEGRARRFEGLVERGGVSRQDYDDAVATAKQARAQVGIARAARDRAQVDLDRTTVTAPIAGQVGRSAVTEGALVAAGQPEPLATVTALDPVYVDVTRSSAEMLRWRREHGAGLAGLPVSLILEDGEPYEHEGELALTEVSVDTATGAVALRAVFPNPSGLLLPGMFVRATIAEGVDEDAILVPQAALSRTADGGGQVFVVSGDGTARARPVEAQRATGGDYVVSGLAPGETLILDGFQRFRDGDRVTPQPVGPLASGGSADAAVAGGAAGGR